MKYFFYGFSRRANSIGFYNKKKKGVRGLLQYKNMFYSKK